MTIILFTTLLSSCSLLSMKPKYWIVTDIENADNWCIYELETFGINTHFVDKCDKYNIGDTVMITK